MGWIDWAVQMVDKIPMMEIYMRCEDLLLEMIFKEEAPRLS